MRQYMIYLIEEEISRYYFGKEHKLYEFFLEAKQDHQPRMKQLIQKQMDYIVRPISYSEISKILQRHCRCLSHANMFSLNCSNGTSSAKLMIQEKEIKLLSKGYYDAEATFLEILRQFDKHFFAIDYASHQFGWLNPIKDAYYITQ
ncbi:sporulation inhibitor of replication protein SirA [Terrilactibacillus laevilacticus]|uniref:Sporulation inhibitor of replication protein SirA n=1 Tax=Terrilactibacillus laevilacticus TaxID=1380157 RepID=A0ABW5PPJ4_9BACI|nr:sporulation inhibitor of replication protein SirA [Terrilactibacillus laevilacticus]